MKTSRSNFVRSIVIAVFALLFSSNIASAQPPMCPVFVKNSTLCHIEISVDFHGMINSVCTKCPGAAGTQVFMLTPGQVLALPCSMCGPSCDYKVTVTKVAGMPVTNTGSKATLPVSTQNSNWSGGPNPCVSGTNSFNAATLEFTIQ